MATNLKMLIEKKHVNVSSLAQEIGVTSATIWNWANGDSRISGEGLLRLADFFNVSPAYILQEVEELKNKSKLQKSCA